jgi:hypothetical protein
MWLALFCVVGLGPAIAIKVAAPPASSVVEPAQDQSKIEPVFAPNESAKSDRLELRNARAETEIIVPATKTMPAETLMPAEARMPAEIPVPAETPSTSPQTIKKTARRHWQDANAKISPVPSTRRYAEDKESKKSAGKNPPNERTEVWHCRQDAVGGLLRSLDLSPRCNM